MEKKKYNVFIIILFLLIAILIGYIIFDELNSGVKKDEENTNSNACSDKCYDNKTDVEENENTSCNCPNQGVDAQSYQDFLSNIKSSNLKLSNAGSSIDGDKMDAYVLQGISCNNYGISSLNQVGSTLTVYFTKDEDGMMYVKKYGNSKVLSKNVLYSGFLTVGQDNSSFIWFVDNNGTLYYVDNYPQDNEPLKVKKSNIMNVVNVTVIDYGEDGSLVPVAITHGGEYINIK